MNTHPTVSDNDLVQAHALVIQTRRAVWNLERKGRFLSAYEKSELTKARRAYRGALATRKRLNHEAQQWTLS